MGGLVVVETHPVQYHAPVYREIQRRFGVAVTAIYGSDFSVAGYRDKEFGARFSWDTDLLSGYEARFLGRVSSGGAGTASGVSPRGLGEALKAAAPAVMLVTGYGHPLDRAAWGWARSARCPLLFRGETTDHAKRRGWLHSTVRDAALRRFYADCGRLLYVGSRSRQHFERLGCPPEKLIFSPYCVDAAPFRCGEADRAALRDQVRTGLGIGQKKIALLFSGKLSPRKDPGLLVKAARVLPVPLRERLVLIYMGAGELAERVKALANVSPKVESRFLGFRNQKELSPIYHAADLLVMPSLHSETWGLVVNEALLHGLPAVVSNEVGCGPDLVEPGVTGELFEAGSIPALAAAIQAALPLAGSEQTRKACREKLEQFSVRMAALGIAEGYRALSGKGAA